MKQIVLGTAGHIDHGKTSLIKALTNIDTDRLKEEKERGITIDLGFAFLNLTDDIQLGIVDVPGHERFVKNMLAGVGGIDLVVLVIAADEGVMPQTREHLAICELLRVREGLDTLLEVLRALCQPLTPRSTTGPVRLPIDRVFTMRGFGVVVTGTLFSGSLHLEERMEVLPQRETARVRGLQVHNQSVAEAVAGQRTAVNLQGLEKTALQRGDVLVTPGRFPVTYMLDVTLTLLADAPRPLKHRDRVRFHIGTSEIMGRVILLDRDEAQPGEEVLAQLHLEEPTVAAAQDRYVLRSYSPIQTIAGGMILNTVPARHRRRRPQVLEQLATLRDGTAADALAVHLANAEYAGLQWSDCLLRSPLDEAALRSVVHSLREQGLGIVIDDNPPWLLHREQYVRARTQMVQLLQDFHRLNPLKPAMFTEELRSKFPGMPEKVFNALLQDLTASGELEVSRDKVKLARHTVTLSPAHQVAIAALESDFRQAAYQPPSVDEALGAHKLTHADA